jgi:putative two-component system response regulator
LTQRGAVLIVDDEAIIRRMLSQALSGAGYTCLEAGNAEEALTRFRSDLVDVALLDINMPGRSGTQLLNDVISEYPDVAIIMVTAVSDNEVCIDCMRRGAYDYIIKPFNPRELLVRVSQALEKRRLRLENKGYQHHLEERVQEQSERIRSAFFNAVTSLAQALEAKDKYTSGHSGRVADISIAIASQMGRTGDEIARIHLAAKVHDIGKIGINEAILNKPGRLTDEEYQQVCHHCEIGERILKPITQDEEILSMVRHHHERYDGKGYPDGLPGNSGHGPASWSILALADTYDAMTSDRPYRKALPVELALREIRDNAGSQFDAEVVDAFFKTVVNQ